jgi:complex I intermediate-associated protein 30 (CIA30)
VTSDTEMGGNSKASMQPVAGGANGSKGALQVTGEVVPGAPFTWGGIAFHPGSSADEAVNLSSKKTFSFWAKGDGKSYAVAVMTESSAGQMPGIQPFVAGPEWKQYTFSWSDFKTDGHDVTGIAFAHAQEPGTFQFEIDDVEIK